jgi:hypothetical protein
MADAAEAITVAAKEVFPSCRRAMCYFHVTQKIKDRVKALSEEAQKFLYDDISFLQLARNEEEFNRGIIL